ncbi:MAG: inovirus Gp2 family protein [Moraxellaceae bacterium]|nr:MAG: inovirus Gp2 family protein [Moraxellaceae bacterium]
MNHSIISQQPYINPVRFHHSEAHITLEIEQLVNTVMSQRTGNQSIAGIYTKPVYQHRLESMSRLLSVYEPDYSYEYSEHLMVFWRACRDAGILHWWDNYRHGVCDLDDLSEYQFEDMLESILHYGQTCQSHRRQADRRYEMKKKQQGIQALFEEIMQRHSKVLAVRTSLYYQAEYYHENGIRQVYGHLDEFIQQMAYRKGLFDNLLAYAWVLEQGTSRGYHIHLSQFFNGSRHQYGRYLGDQSGKIWQDVTHGMGYWHNSNAQEKEFEARGTRGIGMLHRNCPAEYECALRNLGYLADPEKLDQYLRKKPKGRRSFGKSWL